LENAQGLSTIDPPPLFLSSQLYSPNCQLLLSSSKEPGIKIEIYYNKAISYAGLATIIAVIQIFSLIHQMEFTPTPSVSKQSEWLLHVLNLTISFIRVFQTYPIGQSQCKPPWMAIFACCI
jgi:hypothetical protein